MLQTERKTHRTIDKNQIINYIKLISIVMRWV